MSKELTEDAQIDRDDFNREYHGGNCSCHISPPCGSCTHPGNPLNQSEDVCYKVGSTGGGLMKTSALDYEVAKCENLENLDSSFSPSTNWSQGGPIIVREKIGISVDSDGRWTAYIVHNYIDQHRFKRSGTTPLIAAMRCYIAMKYDDRGSAQRIFL